MVRFWPSPGITNCILRQVQHLPGPPRILVLTEISRNPAISPELAELPGEIFCLCTGVLESPRPFRPLAPFAPLRGARIERAGLDVLAMPGRVLPQIVVFIVLTIASVAAVISGFGRSSRAFLPGPW